ncbi:hypothetical protein PZB75_19195 [Streptomyces sp. AM 4-1-1]|uniref:hypothetical protein n=1 Tax=unclassified Streptomyces TaxID=2593676 RepID=UPI0023B8ABFF|nr:hypothetical protein [Streptomyces sp. AM 4-1-1]WEH35297.1 hypothetical protein PZB75_19195 [Streptomyces sp. AM 4-1-1]
MNEGKKSLGYEPDSRRTQDVKGEIASLSSKVLDMMGTNGKVTEPGPNVSPCDDSDSADYYRVRHPWSMYGVSNTVLEKGMANLSRELPRQGWKIEKEGKDSSANRNLEILAVHPTTRSQLEVTWLKGLDGHEALIEVSLYSRCFRSSDSPSNVPTAGG